MGSLFPNAGGSSSSFRSPHPSDCGLPSGDDADSSFWQLRYLRWRQAKVVGDKRRRISRQPCGNGNLLVHRAVEQDQDPGRLVSNLFHEVAESLFDECYLAGGELFRGGAAVGAKNRNPRLAGDVELPLVCIRMPVHLSQRARLQVLDNSSECGLDGKLQGRNNAFLAPGKFARLHGAQSELVRKLVFVGVAIAQALDRKSVV